MYNYRRNLSEDEVQAREEILARTGAVKLTRQFMSHRMKYCTPAGPIEAAVQPMVEEVIRLGLAKSEVNTEILRPVLARIENQLTGAISPNYRDAFEALYRATPEAKFLRNEANERFLTQVYEAEWPHDTFMDGVKLQRLFRFEHVRNFVKPNDEYVAQQDVEREQARTISAQANRSGSMIAKMLDYLYRDGEPFGKNPYEKTQTQRRIDKEQAELMALSTEALEQRYAQWVEGNRLRGLSSEQIKAELKATARASRAQQGYSQFELIPDQYIGIGKTEGVDWSRRLIQSLPSTEISRLSKRYSFPQIEDKIQEVEALARQGGK